MTDQANPSSPKARARAKTEQMRAERAAQAKRAKRLQRTLTIIGCLAIVGLVITILVAVLNASGGGDDNEVSGSQEVTVPDGIVDGAIQVGEAKAPVTIDLYYDYMCPACGAFEQVNAEDLTRLIDSGTAVVNLRMMNFLDAQSEGTAYSTRAGNAVATVANEAPEAVWEFHNALYANQPAEGTEGLTDEEIAELAVQSGVPAEVTDVFSEGTYRGWVAQSNDQAAASGVNSTPTVKLNGKPFEGDW